ncbi:MAG TPA: hypothetical protein PKD10_09510 [Paracoccaceae bacterium]|nr:hypothetical protein [Paracoccaceae bacterium]HMO72700.1 hypothetical protein [Paracoccaceae bacterium]
MHRLVRMLAGAAALATAATQAAALDGLPLPDGWEVFLRGSFAQTPDGIGVFSVMLAAPAPLYADLPDADLRAALAGVLAAPCRSPVMAEEIAGTRAFFQKALGTSGEVFGAARMQVRWETTTAEGSPRVEIFETLHDIAADGSCGERRTARGGVLIDQPDLRVVRD